jgi:hypothetical protein
MVLATKVGYFFRLLTGLLNKVFAFSFCSKYQICKKSWELYNKSKNVDSWCDQTSTKKVQIKMEGESELNQKVEMIETAIDEEEEEEKEEEAADTSPHPDGKS